MKVQIIASTALMLLSAIPGALSAEHLHAKEAVTATAADFEDDFEEKSPSAKSFSLRGAVAAASAEDAADEEEELEQYGNWKNKIKKYEYKWKRPKDWGAKWQGKHCKNISADFCPTTSYKNWKAQCKVRNNKCVPRNFEDEEFDSQDLEMFDAPEDAADEDEELIQWQKWQHKNWDGEWKNHANKWQNKNWDDEWKNHANKWQNKNWDEEWKHHANKWQNKNWNEEWKKYATGHGGTNPYTGKPYGSEWQNGEHCYKIHVSGCPTEDYQGWKALCKVRNNKCVPRN